MDICDILGTFKIVSLGGIFVCPYLSHQLVEVMTCH